METPDSPRNFSMSISSDEERPRCFAYEGSSGASSLRGLADDLLSDFDSPNNTSIGDIAKDLFAEIEKQPPPAPPVRQISKPVRDVRKASDSTMLL